MSESIANGFRVRPLNADCDKLAVQSTHQTTWFIGSPRRLLGMRVKQWHEIGLGKNELIVLRSYDGACPEIELECLGTAGGALIVDSTRQFTRTLRVGGKLRWALRPDEAVVIRCESIVYPSRMPNARGLQEYGTSA